MIKIPGPLLLMEVFVMFRKGLFYSRHGVWFSSGHLIFKARGSTLSLRARYCSRSALASSLPLAAMKHPVHMVLTVSPWAFPWGCTFCCCGCGTPHVPCVLFHLRPCLLALWVGMHLASWPTSLSCQRVSTCNLSPKLQLSASYIAPSLMSPYENSLTRKGHLILCS